MNENKKVSWLYVLMTVLISSVAVVFQNILTKHYVDEQNGLYKIGVSTPMVFYVFVSIAVLFILTAVVVMRMDSLPKDLKYGSVMTTIFSFVAAVLVALAALMFFKGERIVDFQGNLSNVYKLRNVCAFLAIPSAMYYLSVAFSGKVKKMHTVILSFFPLILTLVYLMSVYFDKTQMLNDPYRIMQQVALVLLMLYQLFETRAYIGKSKPIIYFMITNIAILFVSIAFVPDALSLIKDGFKLTENNVFSLYGAGMVLYLVSRSIDFAIGCDVEGKKITIHKANAKNDIFTVDEEDTEDIVTE